MKMVQCSNRSAGRGRWAKRVCPRWLFTYYDCAERLGLSLSRTKALVRQYGIPTGLLKRRVRLGDGTIRTRYLCVLTPTALETLLMRHAGLVGRLNHQKGR